MRLPRSPEAYIVPEEFTATLLIANVGGAGAAPGGAWSPTMRPLATTVIFPVDGSTRRRRLVPVSQTSTPPVLSTARPLGWFRPEPPVFPTSSATPPPPHRP